MTSFHPNPGVLRAMSDETVMRELLALGRATRAELAARTGLSKPTVAEAVRRLVAKGLVRDTGDRTTTRGGVGTYYAPGSELGLALAVAIAPEGIVVEAIDVSGKQAARAERAVERPADPTAVRRLLTAAARAVARQQPTRRVVVAVVSAADPVDRASGRLVQLPDEPFLVGQLDPVAALRGLVQGPVVVDNDVNWAVRRERAITVTPGSASDDLAYLYLGEGLGCAVVCDGEVRRGHTGLAGEVAHVVTVGPRGIAMPFTAVFDQLGVRYPQSAAIDVRALLAAVERRTVLRSVAAAVAGVVSTIVALIDPSAVVLGGSWGTHPRVVEAVGAAVGASPRPVDVRPAQGGPGASLEGAREDALRRLRNSIVALSRSG
jgi:predicted NBD/HSP70 family sugar kinase